MEEKAAILAPMVTMHFPSRPGLGRAGTPVALLANHFKLSIKQGQDDIYHYDVSMAESGGRKFGGANSLPPKSLAEKIIRALLQAMKTKYPREVVVSDMRKNLYTPRRLPFDEEVFDGLDIGETRGADASPVLFRAVVRAADPVAVRMSQLVAFFSGQLNYTPYDALQALDIATRHTASQRLLAVGRSLYKTSTAKYLGEGADCLSGYFQSVRPTQNRLVINLDLASTAFVSAMPVLDFVFEVSGATGDRLSTFHISKASKAIAGVKVKTTHRPGVKRAYRVNRLSSQSAASLKFTDENGKECSVADYFRRNYFALKYPHLPCVHVGARNKKVYLPIEVCEIIAGQKCPRKMTEKQTSEMIKIARTSPSDRRNRVEQIVREADFNRDPVLQAFGVSVDPKLTSVQGRVLPAPTLEYGGGKSVTPSGGEWRTNRTRFLQSGQKLESFAVICFADRVSDQAIKNFFKKVLDEARALGMATASKLPPIVFARNRDQAASELFRQAGGAAQATYGKPPQLFWTINPFTDPKRYGDIKCASDVEYGIPSQCMLGKHVEKANPQYIANILLKVHVKLGGVNWKLAQPVVPKVHRRTIIFGADVTHPSPGDTARPSIAAVVGSTNHDFTSHASAIRAQGHRVEQIVHLKDMIVQLMKAFYRNEKMKPDNIIFYRDGVSEGQFQMVLNEEVTAIREACAMLEKGYQPAITFIIVQKRHHTRFFVSNSKDAERSGNVKPGTVVDNGVCHPTEYDFYLNSHAGIQGTSRPTHYHVLMDEIQLSADELQSLTYRLCYLYARCQRSVSMVPSAYYSHLLAYRARYFLPGGYDSASDVASTTSSSSMETDLRMKPVHARLQAVQYYI